jgi:antitoxin (DNA-binding transcriptional repressor) of toxin-antitoxin stability system
MATLHISESEAIRDFAAVLDRVRAGTEVIIESEDSPIAVLRPPEEPILESAAVEHDLWFRSQVEEGLSDTREDFSGDEIEAYFAARRAVSLSKFNGPAE